MRDEGAWAREGPHPPGPNWLGVQLSALWSAARSMFIPQHAERTLGGALPWMDLTVTVLLNVSMLVLVTCGLVLWAARRRPA